MEMGERIKQLRIANGLTQEELGKYIGVQKSAIRKYEKGAVKNIKRSSIEIMSSLFKVSPSYLMCIENTSNSEEIESNYFEFTTEDDAMFPLADIGDKALIFKQDKIDDVLTPGKGTYLIKLDNKNTIRKIELSKDEKFYTLTAMNPCYKTADILKDELYEKIQIIGKVVKTENQSAFK